MMRLSGKYEKVLSISRNSETRIMKFVECLSSLGLPCSKKLRQDMPIRWNSTYQILESALHYQQAYIHYDLVDPDFRHGLFEDEWKRVKIVATFLKPFYDITTFFSGCKYPTTNLYLPKVWRIEKLLEEQKNSGDSVMSEMATYMLRKFEKYWRSYSVILSMAIILDPRYNLKFVKFCFTKLNSDTDEAKLKVIKDNLQLLFKEYLIPSTTTSLSEEHASGSGSNEMGDALEEFDMFESQLESNTGKTQLDLYLEEASLDHKINPNLDVLGFWKDNRLRYPELSSMARDVLSVPITTVASESAFSIGGRVIGKFRSSILPANAEAQLCTRDWICGQEDLDGSRLILMKMRLLLTLNLILRSLEVRIRSPVEDEIV
ncbi:zinc finger BED domain-containing protein DAYSLEEPER-like [Lycium barbarum]|uniref:zinc finger BED domain-containing protein DAYSLEEPER-like n=1 Tax=Lycium barbarum TaxID=112863 RepID=UPI00293ED146|nr:zinc finger BED domain-containing protein DAYSLEEPER-like [Lycium barbarum]